MSDDAERERARYEALSALVDGYRRERDEARDQLYLTKREVGRWVDRETKAVRERDEARAEAERLRRMLPVHPSSLTDACTDAWHRGAEAMREACVKALLRSYDDDEPIVREVRALPIPEEE